MQVGKLCAAKAGCKCEEPRDDKADFQRPLAEDVGGVYSQPLPRAAARQHPIQRKSPQLTTCQTRIMRAMIRVPPRLLAPRPGQRQAQPFGRACTFAVGPSFHGVSVDDKSTAAAFQPPRLPQPSTSAHGVREKPPESAGFHILCLASFPRTPPQHQLRASRRARFPGV